ncbi:class II fructose-bisphosphatase [Kallotenue papyrolyticum]|uniref:class II fructose-bisphosphatase n=1 Tax=Kallotenue papyrolyticum TaxID=1325125 RepID=UPI000492D03C
MKLERNIGFELVRATEAAALRAGRFMGRGDKNAADQAAVDAMRYALDSVDMDGVVVIGEGEKDQAPMLYIGERLGNGTPPAVDIAVDPVEGTTLLAEGMPGAIAVVAVAERGSLFATPGIMYMEKIAVGEAAAGAIDITAPVATNIRNVARALNKDVDDITVVVLDRPRHKELIQQIRETGARIRMILHGDVSAGVMTATENAPVDILMGIGGAPEAVITACALKCLGGAIQCRLWPRNDEEWQIVKQRQIDVSRVYTTDDLCQGEDVHFAATGITTGELLRGVQYFGWGAKTHSIVMRSRSGTSRYVEAIHRWSKLMRIAGLPYDQRVNGNEG